jgi:oligopeptide transport system ATP-binding protein
VYVNDILIQVIDLKMYFPVLAGVFRKKVAEVKAVDGISFSIKRGETLGLVGESGCGKTTTGRCILQLNKATYGQVLFEDTDLCSLEGEKLRAIRRHMQLIFQDPFASLNPRMTAGKIVGEPLIHHDLVENNNHYREKVQDLFRMVELDPVMMARYPHEFSGGQRQRIGIARALAVRPKLIICDEPVSALDVSIQAQIIDLLERLREEFNLTYLFIAHDLSVVRHISDRVAVMYLGKLVEVTNSDELYDNPQHPYTQALLSAIPLPDPIADRTRERILLTGDVPSPINPPSGCSFHPRCQKSKDVCSQETPILKDIGNSHWVACHQ